MKEMPKEVLLWRANLSRAERKRLMDEKAKYIFTNWRGHACIWCGPEWYHNFTLGTWHKAGIITKILNWWEKGRGDDGTGREK